jgi:hypothetical protein
MLREATNPRCEDLDRRLWKGVQVKLASAQGANGYTHCSIFVGCVDLTNFANKFFAKEGGEGAMAREYARGKESELISEHLLVELQNTVSAISDLHTLAHDQFGCDTLAVLLPEHQSEVCWRV